MRLFFLAIFTLLNSCMTYHPNTSIEELKKDGLGKMKFSSEDNEQDLSKVEKQYKAQLNLIRHCYEEKLRRDPKAHGKIALQFIVSIEGKVESAEIKESTMNDSTMENCIIEKVLTWTFPKPRRGKPVTVNYPFSFNPL